MNLNLYRAVILTLFIFCIACSNKSNEEPSDQNSQSPNIIFIMADDMGYGDVGYMGHPDLKTPNLNEMARTGLRLDRFYSASPICSPTRASVLTGRSPNRSGTFSFGHNLRPQEKTVITHLNQAGYQTGFFGKWHLGSIRAEGATSPGAFGFNEWIAAPNFYMNDPWMSRNGTPIQLQGEGSAVTMNLALEFIEQATKKEAPFVTFIWTGSPHRPHEAMPELQDMYSNLPDHLKNYYGEITGIDKAVGQLRDKLRELGIAEQTFLWFSSDNGGLLPEANNGELRDDKGSLWEGGIRVPSVIEWPGHIEARVSQMPASTVDLFPTFLELANIEPDDQVNPKDGISLVPLINGEIDRRKEPIGFWHYGSVVGGHPMPGNEPVKELQKYQEGKLKEEELNEGLLNPPDQPYKRLDQFPGPAAWIDGNWKLHSRGDSVRALYDLVDDPGEENNLLGKYPERTGRMHRDLKKWQNSVINSIRGGDY